MEYKYSVYVSVDVFLIFVYFIRLNIWLFYYGFCISMLRNDW